MKSAIIDCLDYFSIISIFIFGAPPTSAIMCFKSIDNLETGFKICLFSSIIVHLLIGLAFIIIGAPVIGILWIIINYGLIIFWLRDIIKEFMERKE